MKPLRGRSMFNSEVQVPSYVHDALHDRANQYKIRRIKIVSRTNPSILLDNLVHSHRVCTVPITIVSFFNSTLPDQMPTIFIFPLSSNCQ